MIDLQNAEPKLILNPRLPERTRLMFESAWVNEVVPKFQNVVGIATSGSSGHVGKIIVLSHAALKASAAGVNALVNASMHDVWMKTLPDFHVGGLGIKVRASLTDARVFESQLEKWDARLFQRELGDSRATLLSLVPTQLFDLVQLGNRAPSSLRVVFVGGGRLEQSLATRALELGWPIIATYGMTECSSMVAGGRLGDEMTLRSLSHVRAQISADGRLEIASEALLSAMLSFNENGEATLTDPKHNSWFTTEDVALINEGAITILGRKNDFVKIGGEGVVVSRLEDVFERVLFKSGFKAGATLLAAHDDRLGAAIVVLGEAPESEALGLIEAYNREVAPFERVRAFYQVARIPRASLGKILRADALALVGLKPALHV